MERGGYLVRRAAAADAAIVARHRVAMFRDMGLVDDDGAALEAASCSSLRRGLADGSYTGWLVEYAGAVVAGGGLLLRPLLPRPGHLSGGREAYVLNVYTDPPHRRRGLARRLMETILAWCEAEGVHRVSLHASDDGRELYAALGFAATNEMRRDTGGGAGV
jgi:GNAT superfamily N-acetyltransferase